MENSRNTIVKDFWKGKKVFITGHTGFKGSWLSLWLHLLGVQTTGYALNPPTNPNLYQLCNIDIFMNSIIADIRDLDMLKKSMLAAEPDIVIHMAAQPLVRDSYINPVETYSINAMGTINLLEAVRSCKSIKAVINVTTDKCYENKEWFWGYRESEPLGGYDPYSCSKACSELITSSYRNSFFNPADSPIGIATARAGNVIGGGDWATDRLIPDCIKAILNDEKIIIRNPDAIRPWQHVLEPLSGYLLLAQNLFEHGAEYGEGWNFGPDDYDAKPVEWIVKKICEKWESSISYEKHIYNGYHEAKYLKLDCSKAKSRLGWHPRWNLEKAIDMIVEWVLAYKYQKNIKNICLNQIEAYSK